MSSDQCLDACIDALFPDGGSGTNVDDMMTLEWPFGDLAAEAASNPDHPLFQLEGQGHWNCFIACTACPCQPTNPNNLKVSCPYDDAAVEGCIPIIVEAPRNPHFSECSARFCRDEYEACAAYDTVCSVHHVFEAFWVEGRGSDPGWDETHTHNHGMTYIETIPLTYQAMMSCLEENKDQIEECGYRVGSGSGSGSSGSGSGLALALASILVDRFRFMGCSGSICQDEFDACSANAICSVEHVFEAFWEGEGSGWEWDETHTHGMTYIETSPLTFQAMMSCLNEKKDHIKECADRVGSGSGSGSGAQTATGLSSGMTFKTSDQCIDACSDAGGADSTIKYMMILDWPFGDLAAEAASNPDHPLFQGHWSCDIACNACPHGDAAVEGCVPIIVEDPLDLRFKDCSASVCKDEFDACSANAQCELEHVFEAFWEGGDWETHYIETIPLTFQAMMSCLNEKKDHIKECAGVGSGSGSGSGSGAQTATGLRASFSAVLATAVLKGATTTTVGATIQTQIDAGNVKVGDKLTFSEGEDIAETVTITSIGAAVRHRRANDEITFTPALKNEHPAGARLVVLSEQPPVGGDSATAAATSVAVTAAAALLVALV